MTTKEIKIEIQKVIDTIPENALEDILNILKQLQSQPKDKMELSHHLRKILAEDKELLGKLAQ